MCKIHPTKAAAPMPNASSVKRIESDLQRASCCCEASVGFVKRITGSGGLFNCGFSLQGVLRQVYTGSQGPTSGVCFRSTATSQAIPTAELGKRKETLHVSC